MHTEQPNRDANGRGISTTRAQLPTDGVVNERSEGLDSTTEMVMRNLTEETRDAQ